MFIGFSFSENLGEFPFPRAQFKHFVWNKHVVWISCVDFIDVITHCGHFKAVQVVVATPIGFLLGCN